MNALDKVATYLRKIQDAETLNEAKREAKLAALVIANAGAKKK